MIVTWNFDILKRLGVTTDMNDILRYNVFHIILRIK
jgi:hypothetical protein